jgi:anti-sigma regulatory factor (Ser/Thr protein kinase)
VITESSPELALELVALEALLPVATAFVEKAASALGLAQSDALSLTLATEEVFAYLCEVGAPGRQVRMHCSGGGYYVEVEFLFQPRKFNMQAFNLAASASVPGERVTDETGLLIASRMVDRFHFRGDEHGLLVSLSKEKTYSEADDSSAAVVKPLQDFSIQTPDDGELKELIRLVRSHYPKRFLLNDFLYPGKVVDMAEAGVYRALIACDQGGHIGGGLVWTFQTPKIVLCYGPFIFDQPQESVMAQELVNECIGATAKSGAVGMIFQNPTAQLPAAYFESLGSLTVHTEEDGSLEIPVYYKHLFEDVGTTVWAHPSLHAFLNEEYRRLVFAREVLTTKDEGERGSPFSVISAEFDKAQGSVVLRPVWWGDDAEETLQANVKVLQRERIPNVFFHIDLGKPWQSHFAPATKKSGFVSRLVLPYCGKGDIVVFQLARNE